MPKRKATQSVDQEEEQFISILPDNLNSSDFEDEEFTDEIDENDENFSPICNKKHQLLKRKKGNNEKRPAITVEDNDWQEKEFTMPETPFTGQEFVQPDVSPTPYECFKMFFTDEMFHLIADQTVLYADQKAEEKKKELIQQTPREKKVPLTLQNYETPLSSTSKPNIGRPKSYSTQVRTFNNDDRDGGLVLEVKTMIGVMLQMGLRQLPRISDYWSSEYGVPIIQEAMSLNRFRFILANLHFRDNNGVKQAEKQKNRLWKIQPLIDKLLNNFSKVPPEIFNSIDEAMIAFDGSNVLKQFMPRKPIKFGFKVYTRAGASGFVYDFRIYQGKATAADKESFTAAGLTASSYEVVALINKLPPHSGYKIFADNFFSSEKLVDALTARGFWYCGTLQKHRTKAPLLPDLQLNKLPRGTSKQFVCGNKVIVQWRDSRGVIMISNYVGMHPIDTERFIWDKKKQEYINVPRPAIVAEYNQYMGGVDLSDMYRAMYAFSLKCRRWYIYIFVYLFNLAVRNAWVYYRKCCSDSDEEIPLRDFIAIVSKSLMNEGQSAKKPKMLGRKISLARSSSSKNLCPNICNKPKPWASSEIGQCSYCTKQKQRHRTYIMCKTCNLHLCIQKNRNCFDAVHYP